MNAADPASSSPPAPLLQLHPALAAALVTGGLCGHRWHTYYTCPCKVLENFSWLSQAVVFKCAPASISHGCLVSSHSGKLFLILTYFWYANLSLSLLSVLQETGSTEITFLCGYGSHWDLWTSWFFSVNRSQSIRLSLKKSTSLNWTSSFIVLMFHSACGMYMSRGITSWRVFLNGYHELIHLGFKKNDLEFDGGNKGS